MDTWPAPGIGARDDLHGYACGMGAFPYRIAVRIEAGVIQVDVAVGKAGHGLRRQFDAGCEAVHSLTFLV